MSEPKTKYFMHVLVHRPSLSNADAVWQPAVEKAREHLYEEMPGQKANRVIHVRPHDSKARYGKDPVFEKAVFHSLSEDDLDEAEAAWKLAVQKAREHLHEEMPGQKTNRVIHVRPHDSKARYGKDPTIEKHRCFWLNQGYIKALITQ